MKVCLKCKSQFSSKEWQCPACGYSPAVLNGFVAHSAELSDEGGGFKAEYFPELAALEETNFWFRARNELIRWALCKYGQNVHSFLEVGCGTGFVLSGLTATKRDIRLSGSEIFLAGLPFAKARLPDADLMQMDARSIPFDQEFDAIGAFDVLEHIQEDERVLGEIHKALKPNGLLILTVPQHPWLWSAADDHACHVRRYTEPELRSKAECAGFDVIRSTSFVSLLLPAMLMSRRRKPSLSVKGDEADHANDEFAEFRLSKWFNQLLYWIMKMEGSLIRTGVNFYAGGSRLLIARKSD